MSAPASTTAEYGLAPLTAGLGAKELWGCTAGIGCANRFCFRENIVIPPRYSRQTVQGGKLLLELSPLPSEKATVQVCRRAQTAERNRR
jgi:hypothetical protein